LERREEGDLGEDGRDAGEGEGLTDLGFGEAETSERDAGVAEEDEEGLEWESD
jgi:hypothetical protein